MWFLIHSSVIAGQRLENLSLRPLLFGLVISATPTTFHGDSGAAADRVVVLECQVTSSGRSHPY